MSYAGPWLRAIIWIALAKVASAIALYLFTLFSATGSLTPRGLLMAAHVVAFGAAAGLLLAGAERDPRAELLGGVLLLTAAVFADNAPSQVLSAWPVWQSLVSAVYLIQVDAFSAWLLWLFVAEFPRVPGLGPLWALPRRAASVSFWAGAVLLVVNLAHAALNASGMLPELAALWRPLVRSEQSGAWLYWLVQYALVLPALPILVGRARAATIPERRRVSLLLAGIVLGAAPTIVWILLSIVWPGFSRLVPLGVAGWVIYPTLLAAPFIVAYAVLVRHALDTRLIVRRALQYAFARYTIAGLAVIPLVVLTFSLYRRRNESVAQVVSGTNSAVLLLLGGAAIVAWRGRRHVIDRLDRRYFREQYDSREILRALVEQCRKARNRPELAESLRVEIDRALHLETLRVLYVEPTERQFSSPMGDVRPLLPSDAFLAWLTAADGAVDVDLEQPSHSVNNLPEADRHWLADAGARLVLPLKDAERRVVGFVSLGDKRSELPFSSEDRLLLSTVAAAASLSLAFLSVHPPGGMADWSGDRHATQTEQAVECSQCGAVHRAGVSPCPRCGGPTAPSLVPRVLAGKFRFLERVGEGGMGVVYRGVDLSLNRAVAIKTLPHVSPEQAVRLRREARAMAAVAHPNLAMIFGSETWNGLPVLIVEYLPGGTLAARLMEGPRPVQEVIDLGVTLADVTGALHRAGILHRDIKPSNIGFAADGTLKLLDFGMARLLEGATSWDRRRTEERQGVSTASGRRRTAELAISDVTTDGRIAGTLPYLSPEAVAGAVPDATFDVWSICVVLFEAIAGKNPAQSGTPLLTMQRITTGAFPDLRDLRPDVDAAVAAFFQRAFSQDASQRPRSASALRDALRSLRAPAQERSEMPNVS